MAVLDGEDDDGGSAWSVTGGPGGDVDRGTADRGELPEKPRRARGEAEDVNRGLELGADAYLTKQKFDQRQLLDTIGQLL